MIEILSIPPLATVQDLGRDGYWYQGLGRAGAMDPLALRVANLLLGNDEGAACLEIPLTPARLRFTGAGPFAIAGAACGATLDGTPIPRTWSGGAKAGQVLELGPITEGARIYLALPGGIDVPMVLGARSTQLREGFGGFGGRVLAAGDVLKATTAGACAVPTGRSVTLAPLRVADMAAISLRALPSTEHDSFTPESLAAFWSQPYRVTEKSNRQGFRLDGTELTRADTDELRSHGIVPGIVQVPGGGLPIVQLADAATMGGYPKIAAVIEPDLWRIAQARPGDSVQFRKVTLQQAARAEAAQQHWLAGLRRDLTGLDEQERGWRDV
ncbi:biotin-dependent carboxyltransferase family protein [Paracoccus sp. (in: a-proteobacteria)]|uniref:5-oxoprolinase subunit C family protein n=1 Tax=Paracoccus sp. TaxID=267 RepID=UPI003A8446E9